MVKRPSPPLLQTPFFAAPSNSTRSTPFSPSIAEIRRGAALMDAGRKREAPVEWLAQDLPQRFEGRVIPVDEPVALAWGDLIAVAKRRGRGLSSMDGVIAATAIAHDLVLATRNIKDFGSLGIELFDPWSG